MRHAPAVFGDEFTRALSGTTFAIPQKAGGRLENERARFSAALDVLGNAGPKRSIPRLTPGAHSLRAGCPVCVMTGKAEFSQHTYMRPALLLLLAIFLVNTSAAARRQRAQAILDDDYVSALKAANRFLQAWQDHDQETVVLLLTNAAKRRCSEDHLDTFLSSDSQAYEVGRGRKLPGGRYAFPITIFVPPPSDARPARPRYTELIIAKTTKNDWAVDKLP